jgi:hypothetical protein
LFTDVSGQRIGLTFTGQESDLRGKSNLEDLGADGEAALKWILKKEGVIMALSDSIQWRESLG